MVNYNELVEMGPLLVTRGLPIRRMLLEFGNLWRPPGFSAIQVIWSLPTYKIYTFISEMVMRRMSSVHGSSQISS